MLLVEQHTNSGYLEATDSMSMQEMTLLILVLVSHDGRMLCMQPPRAIYRTPLH